MLLKCYFCLFSKKQNEKIIDHIIIASCLFFYS